MAAQMKCPGSALPRATGEEKGTDVGSTPVEGAYATNGELQIRRVVRLCGFGSPQAALIGGISFGNGMTGQSQETDHRDTAEYYRGVIWHEGRYRIAECRDGIQWLFQRQRPGNPGVGAAWDTLGYCATKVGLMRLHRAHIGGKAAAIAAFPETFRRRDA